MGLVFRVPKVWLFAALIAAVCWLGLATGARAAATINVTTTTDDGTGVASNCPASGPTQCSLRDAIAYANANSGTTIDVPGGTYDLTGTELEITMPVTIAGQGASASATQIVQQASSGVRVLEIAPSTAGTVSISNVEITGGNATGSAVYGGGVLVDPTVSGVNVALSTDLIDHNAATGISPASGTGLPGGTANGGAIAVNTLSKTTGLSLSGTNVSNNTAQGGTGASSTSGNGGNGGQGGGGGIYDVSAGPLSVSGGSAIDDNQATGGAGGTAPSGSDVGGTGAGQAGGIYSYTAGSNTISGSTIHGNTATGANGANSVGSPQAHGYAGFAAAGGAHLAGTGSVTIVQTTFDSNDAVSGTPGTGGVASNYYSASGGGVELGVPATVTQSTFSNNVANGSTALGSDGGAIFTDTGVSATIVNTTMTGNHAFPGGGVPGGGGGIYAQGALTLASDTLDGNNGTDGSNLWVGPVSVSIGASIIADAAGTGANCDVSTATTKTDVGSNLEDDMGASCGFSAGSGDQVDVSPQLGTLQNNGSPTDTMLPAPGSAPLGNGGACTDPTTSTPLLVDQRNLPRPNGGPCDIGAVQIQAPANTVAPSLSPSQAGVGQSLACTPGTWTGDGTIAFSYAWLRDGGPLAGQSASTYVTQAADVGHTIVCRVTGNSSYGLAGASASSNAVSVTAAAPTVSIAAPSNGAAYVEGQVVKASFSCASAIGIASCAGTTANGAAIDTSSPGSHSFSVTATDGAGQSTKETVAYNVTAVVISGAHQSHRKWRESGKKPVGTTFTFRLSAAEPVTFVFTRHGHSSTLHVSGHRGGNTVKFTGKLPHAKRLAPGKYTLHISAPNANTVTLMFTINS